MNRTFTRASCLAVAGLALSLPSHAEVWNANADFTSLTTNNPNGVWSYGYDSAAVAGYQLKPFDTFRIGALTAWTDGNYEHSGTPAFARNDQRATVNGLPGGEIALHPGPAFDADAAILRFTAPAARLYAVSAQFFTGDAGESDAWVVLNDDFSSPLASLGITSLNPSFAARGIALSAGETLDFVVGNHGDYSGDTTPLSVQIAAVPEPATVWLALLGSMLVGGVSLRRK